MGDPPSDGPTDEDEASTLEDAFAAEFEGELPDTLDRAAVRRMQAVATLLDESIRIPGTRYRIGVDPLVGVVPGAGDLVTAALSMYIVLEANRLGVSYTTLLKMLTNVTIDVAGGSVPYVGPLFDAAWKANERNVELFLADVAARGESLPEADATRIEIE